MLLAGRIARGGTFVTGWIEAERGEIIAPCQFFQIQEAPTSDTTQ